MSRLEIVVAPWNDPPFPVEMIVLEEDTYRVMSAANRIMDLPETSAQSIHELKEFVPYKPGTLAGHGNRRYAIVHDFDLEPSFHLPGARMALAELAQLATTTGLECLAIQAFRGSPDTSSHDWMTAEIRSALDGTPVNRVWLISR